MEKTKKCPYCGEEILAVAKKCKHCGEWLEHSEISLDMSQTSYTPTLNKVRVDNLDNPFIRFISTLKWIGIIAVLVIWVHMLHDMLGASLRGGNFIFGIIPEWLGLLALVVTFTIFYIGFYKGLKQLSSKIAVWVLISFIWKAISLVFIFLIGVGAENPYDEEMAINGWYILDIPVSLVLSIVPGIMIVKLYEGRLNWMGKFWIYGTILSAICNIFDIAANYGSPASLISNLILMILLLVEIDIYTKLLKEPDVIVSADE